jgi:hypothetical protein
VDGLFPEPDGLALVEHITDELLVMASDAATLVAAAALEPVSGKARLRMLAWLVADARGARDWSFGNGLDKAAAETVGKRLDRQAQKVRGELADAQAAAAADRARGTAFAVARAPGNDLWLCQHLRSQARLTLCVAWHESVVARDAVPRRVLHLHSLRCSAALRPALERIFASALFPHSHPHVRRSSVNALGRRNFARAAVRRVRIARDCVAARDVCVCVLLCGGIIRGLIFGP